MVKRGKLYIVSGPAGTGKGTIVKQLMEDNENICVSVSCTTRGPRPGEVDGVHYHFITEEKFSEMVENDMFYEWAHVHLNRYGTPKDKVSEMLEMGKNVILEIDVQGGMQVMQKNPDVVGIFIMPPSGENLEARLRGRNTETEEAIRVRMGNAIKEMAMAKQYPYAIIHEDWNVNPNALQDACAQVLEIMNDAPEAEKNRAINHDAFIDSVIAAMTK